MIRKDNVSQQVDQKSLATRMAIGGVIGLAAISFFVFGVDRPNPEWGKFWMIRPLIITPLAGAFAGLCFYMIGYLLPENKLKMTLTVFLSAIVFIIGLWLGIVLGLAGTMWD
jgi:ABC-type dipeptide/oligopeptide/nickel transport system permease subunit